LDQRRESRENDRFLGVDGGGDFVVWRVRVVVVAGFARTPTTI
jgi:hypothetical protein